MKKLVVINTGEVFASKEPVIIHTLLGSSVGVCMFEPETGIGGMNNMILPGKADMKNFDDSARYGVNTMELLITEILKLGGKRENIEAKVFGGARILPYSCIEKCVGGKTSDFVVKFLESEQIRLISHDLGGSNARKIYFHTDTNEANMKVVKRKIQPKIIFDEAKKKHAADYEVKNSGEVTLF